MAEAPTSRLSAEQIQGLIHDLAQHGDGADRRWALKQLSVGDAAITLPKPLTEEEIWSRVARILKGIGEEASRRCFGKAFPHGVPLTWSIARQKGKVSVPVNLSELYRHFPEAEKEPLTGAPPGYPEKESQLKKKKWIADLAIKLNDARKTNERGGFASDDT